MATQMVAAESATVNLGPIYFEEKKILVGGVTLMHRVVIYMST